MCIPPHFCWGGWTSYQVFKKGEGGLGRTSTLRGWLLKKRGVTFFRKIVYICIDVCEDRLKSSPCIRSMKCYSRVCLKGEFLKCQGKNMNIFVHKYVIFLMFCSSAFFFPPIALLWKCCFKTKCWKKLCSEFHNYILCTYWKESK